MLLFNRISRTDAEVIFSLVQNVSGGAVSSGVTMVLDISAPDGVRVSTPASATLSSVAGVTGEVIASSAYGRIQVFGYNTQAYVTNHTATTIAAGDILLAVNAVTYLARSGAASGVDGFFTAMETVAIATTPAQAVHKIMIRCL